MKHCLFPPAGRPAAVLALLLLALGGAEAQTVKDREGAIRKDAKEMSDNERWIYNDVDAGFAEAERTGKPLMVVLRCVPCMACMGIDAEVLTENFEIASLMDEFVRVRVINANALDLSLFQFDYDLSFSVLFFNADRTVYGRFGSWEHQKDGQSRATSGLRQALERVLVLHENHDTYSSSLAGKRGDPKPWRTPVDMPQLSGKYRPELDWNGQVVKSCVHCHQIGDALRLDLRDDGKLLPLSLIAPYPAPETIGLHLRDEPVTRVDRVEKGSPAEKAGILPGDDLLFLDGQPLVSVADIAWVLHQAPATGDVGVEVKREGGKENLTISLTEGWRRNADISRRVGTWPMRGMAFGGMKLEELDDSDRSRLGISADRMALEAIHVGRYNAHGAARRAGFREGDILVSVDGNDERANESQLIMRILEAEAPGKKLPTEVLRNGKRIELQMPVQ